MQRRKRAAAAQGCEVSFVPTAVFLLAMAHADVNRDAPPAPPPAPRLCTGPTTPHPQLSAPPRAGTARPRPRLGLGPRLAILL